MSTSFSYRICQLQVETGSNDVVENVFGYLYGIDTETEKNSTAQFLLTLPKSDPSNEGYIPYSELSQDQVTEWIEGLLTEKDKATLRDKVQSEIDKFNLPVVVAEPAPGLPW
jgi:hypothetical protein